MCASERVYCTHTYNRNAHSRTQQSSQSYKHTTVMCTHSFTPQHNLYYRFKCDTVLDCTFSFHSLAVFCFALLCLAVWWLYTTLTNIHIVSPFISFTSLFLICIWILEHFVDVLRTAKTMIFDDDGKEKAEIRVEKKRKTRTWWMYAAAGGGGASASAGASALSASAPLYPLNRIVHITPYAITILGDIWREIILARLFGPISIPFVTLYMYYYYFAIHTYGLFPSSTRYMYNEFCNIQFW